MTKCNAQWCLRKNGAQYVLLIMGCSLPVNDVLVRPSSVTMSLIFTYFLLDSSILKHC